MSGLPQSYLRKLPMLHGFQFFKGIYRVNE